MQDLTDAIDVGIGFGVHQTRITVARIAAHAFGFEWRGLVALQPERDGKCMDAQFTHGVFDGLHARLIGERGKGYFLEWNGSVGSKELP